MEACPIKHIAEAEHPSAGELIIAANLPAASKARIVCREVSKTKTEIRLAAAKYPADVGADVTSGPSNWRRRRRRCWRRLAGQIGRHSLTSSQTDGGGKQRQ